jgi:hypothetical protein
MFFTYRAYIYAKQKKWQLHRNFMYRSYALTLSAVSLRYFKWIIVSLSDLAPMDTYRIVAWAGWIFNIVVAELLILYLANRKLF